MMRKQRIVFNIYLILCSLIVLSIMYYVYSIVKTDLLFYVMTVYSFLSILVILGYNTDAKSREKTRWVFFYLIYF